MTTVKLTSAELRLLDIQKARGIPYPDDIFAWREANAAAIDRAGSSGGTRRRGSRGRAMKVARKAGRADPGAAHRGRRHSSAARRGQALAAALTEALAALDAVASEPFPGSAS